MIKIENMVTPSPEQWRAAVMGTRNPLNSWDKSDSYIECDSFSTEVYFVMGENDYSLLTRLRNAGAPSHRKFMRMLPVYLDVTAPLYWYKEFDTYKVGTVANSCSTMHKIHEKEFTLGDFSTDHLLAHSIDVLKITIDALNECRDLYLGFDGFKHIYGEHDKKDYWWQMIQLLPSSYNQKRTVMLNYEVLANMYHDRKNHKLDEWQEFCKWIETLPHSELIIGEEK